MTTTVRTPSHMPPLFELVVSDGHENRVLGVTSIYPTDRDLQLDVWWGSGAGVESFSLVTGRRVSRKKLSPRDWRITVASARHALEWLRAHSYEIPPGANGAGWFAHATGR